MQEHTFVTVYFKPKVLRHRQSEINGCIAIVVRRRVASLQRKLTDCIYCHTNLLVI